MTIDQQLFELMCRAPAVPDWFMPEEPVRPGCIRIRIEDDPRERERLIQWPSAYARMVMEAGRGQDEKG